MVRAITIALGLFTLLSLAPTAHAQQLTLLDFSRDGCPPCRQMEPVVARLESEGFQVQRINGSRSPEVAQRFGVDRFPTFIVMAGQAGGEASRRGDVVRVAAADDGRFRAARRSAVPPTFRDSAILPVSHSNPAQGRPPEIDVPGAPGGQITCRSLRHNPPRPTATPCSAPRSGSRSQDATGHSFGTGTIVDARGGEALVLTCAHLFRDGEGNQINDPQSVTAELYQSGDTGLQVVERVPVHRIHSCNFRQRRGAGQHPPARRGPPGPHRLVERPLATGRPGRHRRLQQGGGPDRRDRPGHGHQPVSGPVERHRQRRPARRSQRRRPLLDPGRAGRRLQQRGLPRQRGHLRRPGVDPCRVRQARAPGHLPR